MLDVTLQSLCWVLELLGLVFVWWCLRTGAELQELQRQVDRLSDPSSPECVGRLLQLRRQVLLLQFDTAVRHLVRSVIAASFGLCLQVNVGAELCSVRHTES